MKYTTENEEQVPMDVQGLVSIIRDEVLENLDVGAYITYTEDAQSTTGEIVGKQFILIEIG